MLTYMPLHPRACGPVEWGFIPGWLDDNDPRSAREQLNEKYVYGGWQPFQGFKKLDIKYGLHYPGDPVQYPFSMITFRNEKLLIYPGSWVCIVQEDKSWEVCRMD
jgi:hypothetical protein